MAADLDRRLFAFRDDIAAASLKGQVQSARFVAPDPMQAKVPVLDLLAAPDASALASQLLFGEVFDVYDVKDDLAWGQNRTDGYVGYVKRSGLGEMAEVNSRITATLAHVYPNPNFKSTPTLRLPFGASVLLTSEADGFHQTPDGYISKRHLDQKTTDFVAEAARLVGAPYLWGGRSPLGLDCSALVQLALMAVGKPCPRDSDMQMETLGKHTDGAYERGDLLFWKGHVGIVFDQATLLHANVHHMCVAFENLSDAIARIAKADGPVTAHKRL